jgi:hypothetical protein
VGAIMSASGGTYTLEVTFNSGNTGAHSGTFTVSPFTR